MIEDKEKILKLQHGEMYTVPESDYGKAEIYRIWDFYILFQIPTFGGTPTFSNVYPIRKIDKLVAEINSWT